MVYSVCTLTVEEGPAQISGFLAQREDWEADGEPRLTLPHRDGADGFFVQRLRRLGNS
jgi:16S rRNA (cytosine967-C5)-methyltransferase